MLPLENQYQWSIESFISVTCTCTVLSFSEQLVCSESKEPEGDWESDILDQINKSRIDL